MEHVLKKVLKKKKQPPTLIESKAFFEVNETSVDYFVAVIHVFISYFSESKNMVCCSIFG